MPAVREALERVRLNRHGACRSEPRTVCQLIPEQPLHALLVDGLIDGYPSGDVQSVERLARSVGVRPDVGNLAPASQHPDRKSTRLNSSHPSISYAVFCLKKKKTKNKQK